jgi:DNA-binding response OmpR family regulator
MGPQNTKILVATDGPWIRDQVRGALVRSGTEVISVSRGQDVRDRVHDEQPDLVILDLQIANMGGIAVAIDLHLEASAGRLPDVPILLLLDREHDRFLAKRAAADGELVKPLDPATLRHTAETLLARRAAAASGSGS